MPNDDFEKAIEIIRQESQPLLNLLPLKVIEHREWSGSGVTFFNADKVSLKFFADFRDKCVDVNFVSPEHMQREGTTVTWPYSDFIGYRISLWQIQKARDLPWMDVSGGFDPQDFEKLGELVKRSIEIIVSDYMDVLEGSHWQ